jgi:hypothetical protein
MGKCLPSILAVSVDPKVLEKFARFFGEFFAYESVYRRYLVGRHIK